MAGAVLCLSLWRSRSTFTALVVVGRLVLLMIENIELERETIYDFLQTVLLI